MNDRPHLCALSPSSRDSSRSRAILIAFYRTFSPAGPNNIVSDALLIFNRPFVSCNRKRFIAWHSRSNSSRPSECSSIGLSANSFPLSFTFNYKELAIFKIRSRSLCRSSWFSPAPGLALPCSAGLPPARFATLPPSSPGRSPSDVIGS